jgi:glycosyltransferase involved in cell wall biosynthesis
MKEKEFSTKSMPASPILSIIIPTHLRSEFLKRALSSINVQAHRERIEVIVVSDMIDVDTDQVCGELLNSGDIFIRRNGAPGPSESRNLGLKLARGKYVMFLDDDDAWQEGFFQALLSQMQSISKSIVYFNCNVVKESRSPTGPIKINEIQLNLGGKLTQDVYVKNQIHMSCFMFSIQSVKDVVFDVSLRAYEDWDFLLSVFDRFMPIHCAIPCSVVYEVDDDTTDRRGSSSSANDFNAVLDYLSIYRRHPSPSLEIQLLRKILLSKVGLDIPQELL